MSHRRNQYSDSTEKLIESLHKANKEKSIILNADYLDDEAVIFIEVGNSRDAMEAKYPFLPLTWLEFEFDSGVCCIHARDLVQQREAILALAS